MVSAPLSHLYPLRGVRLGRLVTNQQRPADNYYPLKDIPYQQEDVLLTREKKFHDYHETKKKNKLRAVVTHVASLLLSTHGNAEARINDTTMTTYTLQRSDKIFEDLCKEKDAREWFERAFRKRKDVYMTVGMQTLQDAEMELKGRKAQKEQAKASLQVSEIAAGSPGPAVEVEGGHSTSWHRETGFAAEGEQIYSIEYRKVQFRLLSSKDIDSGTLEEGSRWKIMWTMLGAPTIEQQDVKDMIEVSLGEELVEGIGYEKDSGDNAAK